MNLENFGIMLEPQEGMTPRETIDVALRVENYGYKYLFRSDHLLPTSGRRGIDAPECWTTLSAIAVSTSRIMFGPLVSPVGFRNPALLAKMATTVHSLSSGRLILGLGAGWYREEYLAFGFAFPDFKTRREQLNEALEVINGLVRNGKVSFSGKHFKVSTELYPRPAGKMHIVIGGKNRSIIRLANKFADEWNVFSPTKERFMSLKNELNSGIEISQMGPFMIAENKEMLDELLKKRMKERAFNGTAQEYIKQLRSFGAIVGTKSEFEQEIKQRMDWGISKFYFQLLDTKNKELLDLLTLTLKEL